MFYSITSKEHTISNLGCGIISYKMYKCRIGVILCLFLLPSNNDS